MHKPKQQAVDLLKFFAIAAVVAIHVLASIEGQDKFFTLHVNKYILWDQILRFCVPLFVALSGYTLAQRYAQTKLDLRRFYWRRIQRTVPLYFLWTGLILLIVSFVPGWGAFILGASWWQYLLLGRADYHLYFVPMIFQLYLLFPILLWLVKRFKVAFLVIVLLPQVWWFWHIGSVVENRLITPFLSDQEQYIFAGSWLFYFVLGIFLATEKYRNLLVKMLSLALTVLGLLWSISNAQILVNLGKNLLVATRFTRLPVLLFSTGLISTAFAWQDYLENLRGKVPGIFAWLGKESYLIYLAHTILLRIAFSYWFKENSVAILLPALLIWTFGMGVSLLMEK